MIILKTILLWVISEKKGTFLIPGKLHGYGDNYDLEPMALQAKGAKLKKCILRWEH